MESYQTRVLGGFDCMVGCRQGILATIAFSSFIRSRWINLTGAQFQFEHANDNEAMRHAALALELLFNHRWLCRRTRRRRRREAGRARREGGRGHGKFQICRRRRDAEHHARGGRVRGWAHTLQIGSSGLDWNMFLRYTRATANDTFPLSRYCM